MSMGFDNAGQLASKENDADVEEGDNGVLDEMSNQGEWTGRAIQIDTHPTCGKTVA
jgi:hypothetical protein